MIWNGTGYIYPVISNYTDFIIKCMHFNLAMETKQTGRNCIFVWLNAGVDIIAYHIIYQEEKEEEVQI